MLNHAQVEEIRDSWSEVLPLRQEMVRLFFDRMAAMNPEIQAILARSERVEVHSRTLTALHEWVLFCDSSWAQAGLHRWWSFLEAQGFKAEHMHSAWKCWKWVLHLALEGACTPSLRAAWATLFTEQLEPVLRAAHNGSNCVP